MPFPKLACGLLIAALPAFGSVLEFAPDGEFNIKTVNATRTAAVDADALHVRFEVTDKWSYIRFEPKPAAWDLSAYTGVEITLVNTGIATTKLGLRVDQAGNKKSEAWNTSGLQVIAPGESAVLAVQFGLDYNHPKPIDTTRIGGLHLFAAKGRTEPSTVTITNIRGVK